jgi:hypothetical protein
MSRGAIYGIALLLSIITISAAFNQLQEVTPKTVSLNDLNVEITTSKKVYHVGDVINGTVWLVNDTPQTVHLDPIYTSYLTAGYTPNLYSATINIDYASRYSGREIPAWGRVGFLPFLYSASQVGTFEIRTYETSASVEVIAERTLAVSQERVTTERSITIRLHNIFNSSIFFGVQYSLSKLKEGTWERFPSDPIWVLVGYSTSPGEEFTQTIDILGLTSGTYRVSKEVSLGGFSGEHVEVSAEFTVDRPPDDSEGVPVYGYYPMVTAISEESLESPDYPMLYLYNRGGLELTLPSAFRIES